MPSGPGTVPVSHHTPSVGLWCPAPPARQPFPKKVGIETIPNSYTHLLPRRGVWSSCPSPGGAQKQRLAGSRQTGIPENAACQPFQVMKQDCHQERKPVQRRGCPSSSLSFSKAEWKERWVGKHKTWGRACVCHCLADHLGNLLDISEPICLSVEWRSWMKETKFFSSPEPLRG